MSDGPLKVIVKSPFSGYSGYGNDGFGLLRALHRWGCDVYPQPTWLDCPIPQDLLPLFAKTLRPPFDLLINHWYPGGLKISREARQLSRVAVAWCVDEATEILTKRGWLRWDEVQEGDQALGINPLLGLAEWQPIVEVYRSGQACHQMVRLTCRGHESLTNPSHRWLILTEDDQYAWRRTAELQPGDQVIRSTVCSQLPIEPKYTDAFVELVAWTYTEGWLERGLSVRIGQNERVNPSKVQRIRSALQSLLGTPQQWKTRVCMRCRLSRPEGHKTRWIRARGLCHRCYEHERTNGRLGHWAGYEAWTESPRKPDGMVIFNVSRQASQEILTACPGKVPSMDFLLALTPAQLDLFIRVSLLADGHGFTFSQTLGPRMDAFITAAVLAGWPVSKPTPSRQHPHLATVRLGRAETAVLAEDSASSEWYEGVIWCPAVLHGNWLARRNGHIFYTGNTMWEFSPPFPGALKPCPAHRKQGLAMGVPDCPAGLTAQEVTGNRGQRCHTPVSSGFAGFTEPGVSPNISTLRDRLQWFDMVLGYDEVSRSAFPPYMRRNQYLGILQGGYDSGDWKPAERDWFGDKLGFFMHGQLGSRKQPWVTIEAWNKLKFERPGPYPDGFDGAYLGLHTVAPGHIFPELNKPFEPQRIKVYCDAWDHATMQEFYAGHHVGVFPSRGEGKNLPALESMTTGCVAAASDYGGHQQWLGGDWAYPLAGKLAPTFEAKPWAARDFQVDIDYLSTVLWHIWTNREEAYRKAMQAQELIPKMCDWQVVVENLFRRIRDEVTSRGIGTQIYDQAMYCRVDEREASKTLAWPLS